MNGPYLLTGKEPKPENLAWLGWAIPSAWLLMWLSGQPAPHADDLFFGGAAIGSAKGNGLSNPWVGNWLQTYFHTDRFYVQPPYHAWLQSWWLRITGVSGAALRGFALVWSGIAAWALADALRRAGVARLWVALACAVWATFILGYGLRADALGLGLVGAGHLLLARRNEVARMAGLWLSGLGVAAHPFALAVAVPVVGAHLVIAIRRAPAGQRGRLALIAAATALGGAALVALLGAWIVDGEVSEFLHVFREHRAMALPGAAQRWDFFSSQFLLGKEAWRRLPFVVLALLILGTTAWRSPTKSPLRWVLAALLVFGGIGFCLYAQYLARYLSFALFLALPLVTVDEKNAGHRLTGALVAAVLLLATPTDVIALVARSLPPPPARIAALRETIASAPHTHIVLDEFSMRYLYDFRPPAHARDWQVGRPAGGLPLGLPITAKPSNELWVVSTYKLAHAITGLAVAPVYLPFGGHPWRSLELGVDLSVVR